MIANRLAPAPPARTKPRAYSTPTQNKKPLLDPLPPFLSSFTLEMDLVTSARSQTRPDQTETPNPALNMSYRESRVQTPLPPHKPPCSRARPPASVDSTHLVFVKKKDTDPTHTYYHRRGPTREAHPSNPTDIIYRST